jgi:hypothetical protein
MEFLSPENTLKIATRVVEVAPRYFAGKLHAPFFIIGLARSGTSLLLHSLACHEDLAAYPGEANRLWHPQTYPWRHSKHRDDVPPIWHDPKAFTEHTLRLRPDGHALRLRATFGAYQFLRRRLS